MAADRKGTSFLSLLWLGFRAQLPFLAVALVYLLSQILLQLAYPAMNIASPLQVVTVVLSTIAVLLVVLATQEFFRMALYQRPKHPTVQLLRNMGAVLGSPPRMAAGLPVFVSLVIFIYAFSNVKGNIPLIHPFSWDRTFDHWDMVLHFGRRPWEWLQPVLGHWPITFAINFVYNLWFFVMFGVWMHLAFLEPPGERRTRFFLTFMLIWMVGGGLLAITFSSAGPCYFGAGYLGLSPDPYEGLMAYLHEANRSAPIWALRLQEEMWVQHLEGSVEASISAMPSLHNGTALLMALASRGWPCWLRRLLWAFAAVIFVGSIHLGWHYAVDSYVIWPLTLAIWWGMGPVSRWWEGRAVPVRFRKAYAVYA